MLWTITLVGSVSHHLTCISCLAGFSCCKGPEVMCQRNINISVKSDRHCTHKTSVCCLCGLLRTMNCHTIKENKMCVVILAITCTAEPGFIAVRQTTDPRVTLVSTGFASPFSPLPLQLVWQVCIKLLVPLLAIYVSPPAQLMYSHSSIFLTWILKIKIKSAGACSAGL